MSSYAGDPCAETKTDTRSWTCLNSLHASNGDCSYTDFRNTQYAHIEPHLNRVRREFSACVTRDAGGTTLPCRRAFATGLKVSVDGEIHRKLDSWLQTYGDAFDCQRANETGETNDWWNGADYRWSVKTIDLGWPRSVLELRMEEAQHSCGDGRCDPEADRDIGCGLKDGQMRIGRGSLVVTIILDADVTQAKWVLSSDAETAFVCQASGTVVRSNSDGEGRSILS